MYTKPVLNILAHVVLCMSCYVLVLLIDQEEEEVVDGGSSELYERVISEAFFHRMGDN